MKIQSIFIFAAFSPVFLLAQANNELTPASNGQNGINFEKNLSWRQILEKAKAENKYIFVDCFATWCGPCKQMDREVYTDPKVGEVYNCQFISVKMQMDSSKNDDESTRRCYGDAHYIREHYQLEGYPTFIFLTPDGRLADRTMGARDVSGFIQLATDVPNNWKNYKEPLDRYKKGKRDLTEMSKLAFTALSLGDTATAWEVAGQYIHWLHGQDLITKDNIELMRTFTKNSKDPGFAFFYNHADTIDQVMDADTYAQDFVHSLIFKEMVLPLMIKGKENGLAPDWSGVSSRIEKKYNKYYADRVVVSSKSSWGLRQKDWPMYTRYFVESFEKYAPKKGQVIDARYNEYAWAMFLYSNEKEELKAALRWSEHAVMLNPQPNWMDTYANILYKLGDKDRAMQWESIALKLEPENKDMQLVMKKMKAGEPTWTKQE